jgi:hypothetical protein
MRRDSDFGPIMPRRIRRDVIDWWYTEVVSRARQASQIL